MRSNIKMRSLWRDILRVGILREKYKGGDLMMPVPTLRDVLLPTAGPPPPCEQYKRFSTRDALIKIAMGGPQAEAGTEAGQEKPPFLQPWQGLEGSQRKQQWQRGRVGRDLQQLEPTGQSFC